jgi:hypothetical protein
MRDVVDYGRIREFGLARACADWMGDDTWPWKHRHHPLPSRGHGQVRLPGPPGADLDSAVLAVIEQFTA